MKRFVLIALVFSSFCIGCSSSQVTVAVDYKQTDPTPRENIKYALLCGVSDYNDKAIADLPFIGSNLDKLAVALRDKAGFTHIICLKDNEVTTNNIKTNIDQIAKQIHGEGNIFLFYFGGHGIAGNNNERLLFVYDTNKNDKTTTLSEIKLKDWLGTLRNNANTDFGGVKTIAMFDACYSSTQGAPPIDPNPLNEVDIIFDSCRINQNSYEGIFTSKFCENLETTTSEVDLNKIFDSTKRDVEKAKPDQSPTKFSNVQKFVYTPSNKVPYLIEIKDESGKDLVDACIEYDSKEYRTGSYPC